ncbi:MAG TPA: acetyl-CoA C-acyltransferase [Gammaproteobacteria bacterium]|jgi:acetyl-CoA C-acetyltransferase|nr:acetyl-CoA C-acyltransferase [Gammaproteobacteria bacterium]
MQDPIVIVSAVRTPIGSLLGELKTLSATQLGSAVIKAAVSRANLLPADIQEVIMGCVLPAGLGQAPARQAALNAGLPAATPCTTINKVCGSSLKAVLFAHDSIAANSQQIILAGGMESMTNAPYLLLKARQGYRLGHQTLYDHMIYDGLEDAYDKGQAMGVFAEQCAEQFGFTRQQQDDYAVQSFERARFAIQEKLFANEIVPITYRNKADEQIVTTDERPFSVDLKKMPLLPAAFAKDGTVTAGNASAIADGAAAVILMRLSEAKKRGLVPLARIIGHATCAKKPAEFTTAPIDAIRALLPKINWSIADVDLFEINEAFAVVVLAAMQTLNISPAKVNVHGGACALGHPIGATGARILVTLLAALQQRAVQRGIACLCIGGGEAIALAIERM